MMKSFKYILLFILLPTLCFAGGTRTEYIKSLDGDDIEVLLNTNAGNDLVVGNNNALVVEGDTDWTGHKTATPAALLDVGGGTATSIDGTDDVLIKDDLEVDGDSYLEGSVSFTGLTEGSVPYIGASGVVSEDNANLFWNAALIRLGVGTAAPSKTLSVAGDIQADDRLYLGSALTESIYSNSSALRFVANSAERLRVDGNGNFFQFGGTFTNTVTWQLITAGGATGAANRNNVISVNTDGGTGSNIWALGVYFAGTGFNQRRFGVRGDGNTIIGDIGAAYPSAMLEVVNVSAAQPVQILKGAAAQSGDTLKMTNSADSELSSFDKDGSLTANLQLADADHVFHGTAASLLFLDSGNMYVGVKNGAPSAELDVLGNFEIGVDGTDADATITANGSTNDGLISWKPVLDYWELADDILMASTERAYFGDTATGIYQSADSILTIFADGATRIGDGTNYTNIAPDGEQTLVGTARAKLEAAIFAVGSKKGVSAPADALIQVGTTATMLEAVLSFSKTVQNDGYFTYHVPEDTDDSVDLEFHLMWKPGAAWTAGDYDWILEYIVKSELDDSTTVASTTITAIDITPANATDFIETEFVATIDANAQQTISCHVYRDVAGDNGDDVGLIRFFEFERTINKLGEAL